MTQRKKHRHMVIPDTQVKKGVRIDHLARAGQAAADYRPDVIIHLGDHWDFPSLSSYDKGKKSFEGRRYEHDIAAGNKALELLTNPILEEVEASRTRKGDRPWSPRLVLLRGNHEQRVLRAIENDPILEGTVGYHDFNDVELGWEVHDFLEVVWIHGVAYSHYFANKMSGRPYGGQSIDTRLKTIGHSFTMGHQQTLMFGCRPTLAGLQYGLVAGNFYQHDEGYRGPQANDEWRGIIVKNEVSNGSYDPMFLSMDYLQRKYGGRAIYA